MQNRILAAVIFLLPIGLFAYFWWHPGSVKNSSPSGRIISQDAAVANALSKQSPNTVAIIASNFARVQPVPGISDSAAAAIAPAGQPSPVQFTNFAPAIVLENVRRAVRQYGEMFGGNPVGTNPEITASLAGNNPKHINFIQTEAGMRVNENGEMVDSWGTPLFFHQISGQEMEIRSAGEDRKMWTADDLLTR